VALVIDRAAISSEYDRRRPLLDALRIEALYDIEAAIKESDLKVHAVYSRVKDISSILGKMERKSIPNPFEEMNDLVGLRIVALFLGDLQRIADLISTKFDIEQVDNKLESTKPYEFNYLSIHLIVRFKSSFTGTRYDSIKGISFEIQIRTIAMDAWAAASHYLDYKSEIDVPQDLKRDFHALSGLFYVADQHFEMFFRSRAKSRKEIEAVLVQSDDPLNQKLNFDTLAIYLRQRYPSRAVGSAADISKLLASLLRAGYVNLSQLDEVLNANEKRLAEDEAHNIADEGPSFSDVGAIRVSLQSIPDFEPEDKQTLIEINENRNKRLENKRSKNTPKP
jgi:putative GTP pyrophosphokinase